MDCYRILQEDEVFGIRYAVTDMAEAIPFFLYNLRSFSGDYICFSNVHTLVTAVENEEYREALNGSGITFPDGAPVAARLRATGNARARRVAGPDFMQEVMKETSDGHVKHFFYGSTPETLRALTGELKSAYPSLCISGAYAPPLGKLSENEEKEIVRIINEASPDIIWVGLGAPAQELFMADHKKVFRGVMMGVGAAFDFLARTKKRAPVFMQKMHLEWLYRLVTEPKRLAGRYFVTNTRFIMYCLAAFRSRISHSMRDHDPKHLV